MNLDGETVNLQVRQVQHDQEDKTEGAIHVNLLTQLWRFVNEDEDNPINGFAVISIEKLPESLRSQIDDERREWLSAGGNLYLQADVQEFIEMVDEVDYAEHRFRKDDSVSFHNQDEDALQEAIEERKPEEEMESSQEPEESEDE